MDEMTALARVAQDPNLMTDDAAAAARALIEAGSDMSDDLRTMLARRDERQAALATLQRLG